MTTTIAWDLASCRQPNAPRMFPAISHGGRDSWRTFVEDCAAAVDCCASCILLDECGDWLDTLPKNRRPIGIVAGRYFECVAGTTPDEYELPLPGHSGLIKIERKRAS